MALQSKIARRSGERWTQEAAAIRADVLPVGHTHTPFVRVLGSTTIVNPGMRTRA
jgi:predicted phosphodiesterase